MPLRSSIFTLGGGEPVADPRLGQALQLAAFRAPAGGGFRGPGGGGSDDALLRAVLEQRAAQQRDAAAKEREAMEQAGFDKQRAFQAQEGNLERATRMQIAREQLSRELERERLQQEGLERQRAFVGQEGALDRSSRETLARAQLERDLKRALEEAATRKAERQEDRAFAEKRFSYEAGQDKFRNDLATEKVNQDKDADRERAKKARKELAGAITAGPRQILATALKRGQGTLSEADVAALAMALANARGQGATDPELLAEITAQLSPLAFQGEGARDRPGNFFAGLAQDASLNFGRGTDLDVAGLLRQSADDFAAKGGLARALTLPQEGASRLAAWLFSRAPEQEAVLPRALGIPTGSLRGAVGTRGMQGFGGYPVSKP